MILSCPNQTSDYATAFNLQLQIEHAISMGAGWLEIWTIYSEHFWLKKILRLAALKALKRLHAPPEWTDDVSHEVLVRIGVQLRKDKTLGFDSSRGGFAAWIYYLVQATSLKSLRQFRDEKRMKSLPDAQTNGIRDHELIEHRIDLAEQIERLDSDRQEILLRYLAEEDVETLARERKVSGRTVYRLLYESQQQVFRRLLR